MKKQLNIVALSKIMIGIIIIPISVIMYLLTPMPMKVLFSGSLGVGIAFYSIGIVEIFDK